MVNDGKINCDTHGHINAIAKEAKEIAISARDRARDLSKDVKWMLAISLVVLAVVGWSIKKSVDVLVEGGRIIQRIENQAEDIDDLKQFNELFKRHLQGDIESSLGLVEYPQKKKNQVEIICESWSSQGV